MCVCSTDDSSESTTNQIDQPVYWMPATNCDHILHIDRIIEEKRRKREQQPKGINKIKYFYIVSFSSNIAAMEHCIVSKEKST